MSKGDITNKVGIQESALDSLLSLLSSRGYLKTVGSTEGIPPHCVGCHLTMECTQKASVSNVYTITNKGKNYLKNN